MTWCLVMRRDFTLTFNSLRNFLNSSVTSTFLINRPKLTLLSISGKSTFKSYFKSWHYCNFVGIILIKNTLNVLP
jgi:hypothetical protein